jgi:photosystem II stability/assembly factor-like uncharacterized protein
MKKTILLLFALTLTTTTQIFAQKKKKDKTEKSNDKPKHYLDTVGMSGLKWRNVGPAFTSGRIADFAVHPDNRAHYYVATAAGGVWETKNAGTTYQPIFDKYGSYSIGVVTLAPSNPNVVWVGTGENNNQRSVGYGDGIYKSENGGASFEHKGLKNSEHIGKILVHPENENTVYVAAIGPLWSAGGDRGLYKTTDGGDNWESLIEVDEHTGVNDVVMDPRNPDVLYAATFQRRRRVFTYVGGGAGSAIHKSTDGGKTWKKTSAGLPGGDLGRIALAISPANPEYIYAIVEAAKGGGFFRSTNRGASWEKRSGHNTSGNYYQEIFCHPTNPDIVYSMDTWMQVTKDGGKSFQQVNEKYKHVDNHVLYIDPNQPDYMLAGCDGGIYETYDGATTWDFKDNLPVTQFYKVVTDNAEPFYNIYGGTQDNFSMGGPSRTRNGQGIINADWFVTQGGDGFESAIDPDNQNIVYAQYQYGGLTRYDKSSGETTGIQPKPAAGEDSYRWNWDAPLMTSKHVKGRIYYAANKLFRSDDRGNNWTTISPDLTQQIDRNTLEVMGRVQSIDAVAKNRSTSPYGTIVAFSESPLNQNLLYVGTDDGLIQISENGGESWSKVSSFSGVPSRTYVNMVLASQHDENVVYACFNNHKNGDFKPYILKSSDKGRTWSNVTNNLPERGSSYAIAEDHVDKNLLFVGTEFSCFFTNNGGGHWKKLSAGLPTIAVRDIDIQKRENDLVLGTFGRGFYVMDDYSPLRKTSQEELAKAATIFPIKDGLQYNERLPLGIRENGFQGNNYWSADNPPVGVIFTYHVKEGHTTLKAKRQKMEKKAIKENRAIRYPTYEEYAAEREEKKAYLQFTIRDQAGNVIRKLKTGLSDGSLNRMVWNGRLPYQMPVSLQQPYDNIFGPPPATGYMAVPGDYTVSLSRSIDGKMEELVAPTPFKLKALDGVTLPAPDRAKLAEFQQKLATLQGNFSAVGTKLGDMDNKLKHIQKAIYAIPTPTANLQAKVDAIRDEMDAIERDLYGDPYASKLDKPAPYSITNRVFAAGFEMFGSTSAPTGTFEEAYRLASTGLQPILARIVALENGEVKDLEMELVKAGAPWTPGREIRLED